MHLFLYTACALLYRDLKTLRIKLPQLLIDSVILLCIQVLNFGYFYPFLGLPEQYIAPLFIGTGIVEFLFHSGFTFSEELIEKIPNKKSTFLQYQLILPIPKFVLFAEYIAYFMLEKLIITLPLLIGGTILLRPHFAHAQGNYIMFSCVYLLALLFIGLFFMMLAFSYQYDWFKDNVWSRRLSWFFNISGIYLLWSVMYNLSPCIGIILLCNPFTHVTESLRCAFLGGSHYLPFTITIPTLLSAIGLCIIRLRIVITKRLDPV